MNIRILLTPILIASLLLTLSCTKTDNEIKVDADLLRSLSEKSDKGDKDAHKKLCVYIVNDDQYDLGNFVIEDDLRSACAELRESPAPE